MKIFLLFVIWFCMNVNLSAQDTLTMMQYNLLYYGEITSFCNNTNNSLEMKDPFLRTILDHVQPDIFTVNELSSNEAIHQHLLDSALNINGINYYRRAQASNSANSGIVNMLYYDSRKLTLKEQLTAQSMVRDVDVYRLYYNANDLTQGDTAFILCVVAHLKAGNNQSDANTRKLMVENTMGFLEARFAFDNVLFSGDFNFYSGSEPGLQIMINYPNADMRFIDPLNQIGDWNNNSFYAEIHTQSTNTVSNCKAGGGLDDRFDFILISDEVRFGTKNIRYVEESYQAVGQDGQHFNGTINGAPQNTSVSQEVADALFNFSDHLPVTLKLRVDKLLDVSETASKPFMAALAPNPVTISSILSFYLPSSGYIIIEVFDLRGKKLISERQFFAGGKQSVPIVMGDFTPGFYFVRLSDSNNRNELLKLIKR
ncbi:MAG: hypothetical protein CVT92_11280 [Bacteroidetes bacterium HGW-Bacteroidetes-1]|jgi:endonuclease/exonuclease/phosphatase family metal-dependent hydrolase|nr:MAG: hypothetical protein CVT92_11280 [Bacteroidetes bacterium HGW-Bacteroidetes-1]